MSKFSELLGVKVQPETKERVNALIEQFTTAGKIKFQGEAIDWLLQQADLRNLEEEMAYGAQLKELQDHTNRINEIFVNLAKQNENNIHSMQREHEDKMANKMDELLDMQVQRNILNDKLTEEVAKTKELTELTAVHQKNVDEYHERIEEQKRTIASMNINIETLEQRIKSFEQLQNATAEMQIELAQKDLEVNKLTMKIAEAAQQEKEKEFETKQTLFEREKELQQQSMAELEAFRIRRDVDVAKLQDKFDALQEKYNSLFEDKQRLETDNTLIKESNNTLSVEKQRLETEITSLKKAAAKKEVVTKNAK